MKLSGYLLFIYFLFSSFSFLRGEELYFRHYSNKEGLSHSTVFCSLQDSKGFMWFGTEEGLNRFDGYNFKVYRHNPENPNSLPHDRIMFLFEDSKGKLWVCTSHSTCYYDEVTDSFYPLTLTQEELNTRPYRYMAEDKNGHLWLIGSHLIIRYDPLEQKEYLYRQEEHFEPYAVTMSKEGVPIFCDYKDLFIYSIESDNFRQIPFLTKEENEAQTYLTEVCQIPDLGILTGTSNAGVRLYNYHDGKIETLIPDVQVRAITPYNNSIYWIATESGVFIYNILNRTVKNLTKSLINEYTISDNAAYSITKDRAGGMWIGTFFGGVNYLPDGGISFTRFIGGKTHPNMLGNAVREICPDEYGNLWIGTEDNGINKYNLQTGEITNFSLTNPLYPLSATNIHGLWAEGNKLWVGTFNKGIDILDIPSGKIIKRYTLQNTRHSLRSDFILCFYRTRKGEMLIGTSFGTIQYNDETDTFTPWHEIYGLVRQIYEDKKDRIWAVTTDGVFKYDQNSRQMSQYTTDNSREGLMDNVTHSVFEDSKGRIWVTTAKGFSLYNETNDSFEKISPQNPLTSNIIYRIVEDNEQNFWITTANGLVKFNPEDYSAKVYSYRDGLHEAQFNYSSSYKSPQGQLYFGTINGLISFHPSNFKEDRFIPPLYITRIDVPQDPQRKNKPIHDILDKNGALKLPYNRSTFSLSYVGLNYTLPSAIEYAYKLEGSDDNWIYMGQNREVTFANLSPGKYNFKVRSTNTSGTWQTNEITLPIIIIPPFWATSWAAGIYILLLIGVLILFYNYKKTQIERKHKLKRERFEAKKEKELYDAKIQFFTFITHEIRTPLTLIKAPLEKILRSQDGNQITKDNLKVIEKNTQRLLDLSNQLLDFRRTESKGFKLNFVKTDILFWMETLVNRFRPVLENEHRQFLYTVPTNTSNADIDRDALTKIVGNLITNAIKYSEQTIHIDVIISEEKNQFQVSVSNDGPLIPETEKEKIFSPFYRLKETENIQGSGIGLSLAYSLTEFHGGTLLYDHTSDGLNQFIVTLPIRQKESYEVSFNETQEEIHQITINVSPDKPLILIVEDQADMRHFIAKELSEYYTVLQAENGQKGLEVLQENPIKLIISDIMMPVMDGFELCNEIKNNINYSHIPFILLTAQHNLQSRLKGLNTGADAYIEKPFSIELVISQINNLLKSREILNRTYLETPLTPTTSLAVSPMDEIFLQKLNDFLEKNLMNEKLNVEMLATEMNMSTSSLYRKVKGLSDISPVDFIKVVRLKKAVQLIQEGETRINEIAFQVGFSSPAYFSTCFQKQYGKSPSDFMRKKK